MFNSQDLRFISESDNVIPQRAEVIISKLQKYFVGQTVNHVNRLMIRFRSKGGEMDTVRQSMNSDVIDVFTTKQVRDQILEIMDTKLGFDVVYVEGPYCFYLVSWNSDVEDGVRVSHVDIRQDNRVMNVGVTYVCDTSVGPFTLRLPTNAVNRDFVVIKDQHGTWSHHNLTVDGNGQKIFNDQKVNLDMDHITIKLTYVSHQNKWVMDI